MLTTKCQHFINHQTTFLYYKSIILYTSNKSFQSFYACDFMSHLNIITTTSTILRLLRKTIKPRMDDATSPPVPTQNSTTAIALCYTLPKTLTVIYLYTTAQPSPVVMVTLPRLLLLLPLHKPALLLLIITR